MGRWQCTEDEGIATELELEQDPVLPSSLLEYCLSNQLVSLLAIAAVVIFDTKAISGDSRRFSPIKLIP
jgi:hypothetical protein